MSYTFKDASGATRTASGTGSGTGGDPDVPNINVANIHAVTLSSYANKVQAVDASGNAVAADDAAAAGPIFPVAGIYQATPDSIDSGDLGRIRASIRRAIITNPDYGTVVCFNNGGTNGALDGAIRNTSYQTFYFNTALAKHPALYATSRTLIIKNGLNTAVNLYVQARDSTGAISANFVSAVSVSAGATVIFMPGTADASAGADVDGGNPWLNEIWGEGGAILLQAPGASGATTGYVSLEIAWRI